MPPGFKGNFGVPKTKGVAEFNRFRTPLPLSYTIPFVPYDWSRQAQVVPSRRVENQTQNLSLTLLSTAANYLFRDPTVTNVRFIIPRRTYEVDQNLRLTLLPTTLKPLTGTNLDWMRQQQVQVRAWEATQNRLILPTTLAPFSNKQIAVERAPFTPQRLAESPYQNILLTYRGQRPFLPEEEDFTRPSWIAPRYPDDPVQNLLMTLLAVTVTATPFIPVTWEQRTVMASRPTDLQPNLLLTLLPVTATPFIPVTWEQRTVMASRPTDLQPNLLLTLLPKTLAPFVNENWPAPPRITIRTDDASQNLLLTLLAAIAAIVPFAPTDWGRATVLGPRQSALEQNVTLMMTLIPQVVFPFSSYDWVQSRQPLVFARADSTYNFLALGIPPAASPADVMTWYHIPHVTRTGL